MHETHARWDSSFQLSETSELSPQRERIAPPPPTRSSFMASWHPVSGAKGYLLDVSTSTGSTVMWMVTTTWMSVMRLDAWWTGLNRGQPITIAFALTM